MLNELRTQMLKKFIQTAIYVPHFLSWAIVSGLTYLLFALDTGPITVLFNGVFGTDANFLADPDWFRPLIIVQTRSEEHTSELQSRGHLVCRLLLEKKKEFLHAL